MLIQILFHETLRQRWQQDWREIVDCGQSLNVGFNTFWCFFLPILTSRCYVGAIKSAKNPLAIHLYMSTLTHCVMVRALYYLKKSNVSWQDWSVTAKNHENYQNCVSLSIRLTFTNCCENNEIFCQNSWALFIIRLCLKF